jgi:hypothetical protein
MAEDRTLPGWPKKKLVKDVRRHLAHYGIWPTCLRAWRTTWIWAEAVARSYWQTNWPLASEIATQYILLLLADMKKSHMLHLPYRAETVLPAEAAAALLDIQGSGILAIGQSAPSTKRRRRRVTAKPIGTNPDGGAETACIPPSPST